MFLDVPGARLRYETTGSGPALLLVPGPPSDASAFAALAPLLAGTRTVITYDPRGFGASTCEAGEITVAAQAADALALLDTVPGPADLVAHSGGGLTALALVEAHPDRLRTAVLVEPPLVHLLPEEAEQQEAETAAVLTAYREDGVWAAVGLFLARTGLDTDGEQGGPPPSETLTRNLDTFFGRLYRSLGAYRPDLDAVRAAATDVVVAVGAESSGQLAHRAAVAAARLLGQEPVRFPGDHNGLGTEPAASAALVKQLLG